MSQDGPNNSPEDAILADARWPAHGPLSSSSIRVAEQHAILGINRFMARSALPNGDRAAGPTVGPGRLGRCYSTLPMNSVLNSPSRTSFTTMGTPIWRFWSK